MHKSVDVNLDGPLVGENVIKINIKIKFNLIYRNLKHQKMQIKYLKDLKRKKRLDIKNYNNLKRKNKEVSMIEKQSISKKLRNKSKKKNIKDLIKDKKSRKDQNKQPKKENYKNKNFWKLKKWLKG